MPEKVTIKGEGITMDLLLWRRHGVRGQGLLSQAYDINQNLADRGAVLPIGIDLLVPDLPPEAGTPARVLPSLFDNR